jgi:hypothetical protein
MLKDVGFIRRGNVDIPNKDWQRRGMVNEVKLPI